jgi:hypothetical protein
VNTATVTTGGTYSYHCSLHCTHSYHCSLHGTYSYHCGKKSHGESHFSLLHTPKACLYIRGAGSEFPSLTSAVITEVHGGFPQPLHIHVKTTSQSKPRPLPSTHLPAHCSLVILTFGAMHCQLLTHADRGVSSRSQLFNVTYCRLSVTNKRLSVCGEIYAESMANKP